MKPASRLKTENTTIGRLRVTIRGAVQGVGFRPFVYRLANELGLKGWVNNSSQGVFIEVEGGPEKLKRFLLRLPDEKPPRSFIQSLESSHLDPVEFSDFEIRESESHGAKTALVLPDIATCPDCFAEIFDPIDRRYRYPFTNCTNCGPRYSIIETLPYDRPNTTMKTFEMCDECRAEYEDPADRRFHAQPNACPKCGPHLDLWDSDGDIVSTDQEAIARTADAIRDGRIVAVKGIGGFHLMVDARNDKAVRELRHRKHREEKPLAVMFPSLEAIEAVCMVDEIETRLLLSPEAPIVLLKKKNVDSGLSHLLAPGNPYLGGMLPYAPLHHLLMTELGFPVVATSGNLSDEPICTDENEALKRLNGIADHFLVHNRPIARHVDDSIVRVMMGREMVVRRARGFAPLPVQLGDELPPIIAVGAHLKNAVAVSSGANAFISQHIGDLETTEAYLAFRRVIDNLEDLYGITPSVIACDRHPDYLSTKFANESGLTRNPVQHHYAHILSCMAENEIRPPALGIAWDGTGYGIDGTIWGGEFLLLNNEGFERIAHLRTFRLPGGDAAVKEPRRSAIGLLYEIFGERLFEMHELFPVLAFMPAELKTIRQMLVGTVNAPRTSSAGRLFDAVASIVGLRERIRFEGQAAMELEFLADPKEYAAYDFEMAIGTPSAIDWEPMICEVIADTLDGLSPSHIAAKFHNTLVDMIVRIAAIADERAVVLSGGCFQNKYLTERAITKLRERGHSVYWHQRVPTNDGGIALGQIAATAATIRQPFRAGERTTAFQSGRESNEGE
jgi:hydrogenase maturation protein HypF